MFVTLLFVWAKFEFEYGTLYFTGLELMLNHGVLAPFLVFISGTFGIIGTFALMKRVNVVGRLIVLVAGLLAIISFLHWIFSDVYLFDGVVGGGGQITKTVSPLLLLVGVGCFTLSVARKLQIKPLPLLKNKLIILCSVCLGTIITLATYFYQVRSFGTINYGFPRAWLWENWSNFPAAHIFGILWSGLILDIIFWSIIAFLVIVMIKVLVKSRRS